MEMYYLFAGSVDVVSLGWWVERVVLPVVLAAACVVGVSFFCVCAFFHCFSVISPLCSCVGQALFGRIKIVSVTVFFLNEKTC